jgi:hypothetical protein
MIPVYKLTKLLAIGIVVSWLLPIAASAKDFKIGEVNKILPTTFCGSYLPGRKEAMLLFEGSYSKYVWINIDGKDIQLTKTTSQFIKSTKRTISKYRGRDITLNFDSRIVRTIGDPGIMETDESSDRVTFKVGNQSKTIQTKGSCT